LASVVEGKGVSQDYAKAIEWFRKRPLKIMAAENNLGELYLEGKGVPEDKAEALKLFRKGADQFYATSQKKNMGVMYENGWAVKQDYVEAAKWYRKAAERGYGGAQIISPFSTPKARVSGLF